MLSHESQHDEEKDTFVCYLWFSFYNTSMVHINHAALTAIGEQKT